MRTYFLTSHVALVSYCILKTASNVSAAFCRKVFTENIFSSTSFFSECILDVSVLASLEHESWSVGWTILGTGCFGTVHILDRMTSHSKEAHVPSPRTCAFATSHAKGT